MENKMNKTKIEEWFEILIKAFSAGIMISIGAITYLSVSNNIIGSILFSLGLVSIIILEMNLFTGKIGYVISQNYPISNVLITLIGNWLGVQWTMFSARIALPEIALKADALASIKMNIDTCDLFILGGFCGILMYVAVEGYRRSKNILIPIMCVSVFILCKFEHSIADMCYLSGLILNDPFQYIRIIVSVILGNVFGSCLIAIYTLKTD